MNLLIQSNTSDRPASYTKNINSPGASARSLLQLPSDFLKTPSTSYQPASHPFSFSERLLDWELKMQQDSDCRKYDSTTLSRSLLVAAFHALIYRYTQQQNISLPLLLQERAKKYRAEINTSISGKQTVRELVHHIAAALEQIQAQSTVLQTRSIDEQFSPSEDCAIAITLVEQVIEQEAIAKHPVQSNHLDLELIILKPFSGVLRYNANLFKADTIDRLSGHLQALIVGMIRDFDCSIAQLPLLTQSEQQALFASSPVADSYHPIHQQIEAHARQQPLAIAVQMESDRTAQQLTYAALNQQANQLAHYLIQIGVCPADRVAVCVEPTVEIAVILLGIFKAGGVYVPIDPTHPIDRLATILTDVQPRILFTQSHLLPNLPPTETFCIDTDWSSLPLTIENPEIEIDPNQTAYIIYTSGTTGKPKGVMASHRNLAHYIQVAQSRFGFDQQDVMPAIARFTFSITMFELLSPLAAGGKLVILDRSHILDFKCLVQTIEQLTVLHTSPSLMQKLLAYIQDKKLNLRKFHKLRHVSCGGDLVAASLLETMKIVFQKAEVFVIYGCSEISCMGCTYPVSRSQTVTKTFVGKPFDRVSVRLYDPDQNLVPIGVSGEIYVSGAGITTGYLNQEDLTQEKFVCIDGERFYRTGDLGRVDADGNLEILGRADFQIKLRGIRIELGEIESALRQSPHVCEGVVVARSLGEGEKSLVAYVVLDAASDGAIEPIRRFLKTKLPDYMIPARFVVLEAMPVNHNQKVDRRALPDPNLMRSSQPQTATSTNSIERELTKIWQKALNLSAIDVKDNFFDLGGHSLLALNITAAIEETFGKTLSVATLYQSPTIETLAMAIEQENPFVACRSLMVIQPGEPTVTPLFCIHVLGRGLKFYRPLAKCLSPDQPLYGLSVQMVDRDQAPPSRVEDWAAYYIKEMQTLQPEGPYLLSGWSFGGIVAFEMARQLEAQGQTVKLLTLMDTKGPNDIKLASMREKLSAYRKQSMQLGFRHAFKEASGAMYRMAFSWNEKLQDRLKALACKYYLKRGLSLPDQLHEFAVISENDQASALYSPQHYSGKLVLFRALDRVVGTGNVLDAQLGWGKLTDSIAVYEVPGTHLSMLEAPNVEVIAEQLKQYL